MSRTRWAEYLSEFHAGRAGITERVLGQAGGPGGDAYDWLAAAVPAQGRVVDVACGSAPLLPRLPGRPYVGVDLSAGELAAARAHGATFLVRGEAAALPVADAAADAVTCSMGLQVLTPLVAVLAEMRRVLVPGGWLVATVPERGPLRAVDLPVLAVMLGALGRRLRYPNDEPLRRLPDLLAPAGLRLVADQRRRYAYRLASAADADLLLASLYLPGLPVGRHRAARTVLRALSRIGVAVPIPVRRIVAVRRASR